MYPNPPTIQFLIDPIHPLVVYPSAAEHELPYLLYRRG